MGVRSIYPALGLGDGAGLTKKLVKKSDHRRPALPVGAGVICDSGNAARVAARIGETVFHAAVAVEVPVGASGVHFLPKGQDLRPRYQRVRIAVAYKDACG